jgi:hypothetical protein
VKCIALKAIEMTPTKQDELLITIQLIMSPIRYFAASAFILFYISFRFLSVKYAEH